MNFITKNKSLLKGAAMLTGITLMTSVNAFAAEAPKPSEMNNPLAISLVVVAAVLLLAIGILAYVVIGAAKYYVEKLKIERANEAPGAAKVLSILALCLLSTSVFAAAEPTTAEVVTNIGGLAKSSFYFLVTIIGLELLILIVLALFLKKLIAKEKAVVASAEVEIVKESSIKKWWTKANSFKPIHEEQALTLDHDYDGIRELDNRLPPWWLYGFYVCILFSLVYLYRYHVSHSAPSSLQEYEVAMAQADAEKEEYLKKSANKVDENSVTLLTDAAALAEGKKIFTSSCAACHGPEAGGIVGPNLTDDYWLHKGSVKDVFKSIKYGIPEKGMKSWKDDFSPVQIAQLSSYIKSLKGTKPANAKEPQGELYTEEASAPAADTTKLAAK